MATLCENDLHHRSFTIVVYYRDSSHSIRYFRPSKPCKQRKGNHCSPRWKYGRLDEQYKTLTYVYIRPWCRISPYLIGMATCHLLSKCNYKLRLSKKFLVLGWTLAILCNCSILFTPVNHNTSLNLAVLYLALSRTGWALGIAWLVVVCTTNHAGNSIFFMSLSNASMAFFLL
ncbi:nose resistant to fluoxetine protein 6-like [Bombus bifarius]|uniref:Nose resistant to fluoxetine protein 6-like n=1 Tax=Bombus bifarius TaxID=103933 RepID=A0A6P8MXT2_9HYME|nr:nose resistant to fluoxetine protein 6-like [Bombus bifarius]